MEKDIRDTVCSWKTESIDVASKSIDDRTRKFSTLSKRIQRDRQHCNYAGYFENYMKSDAKTKKSISLFASFKRLLKNFKAHRYKECSQNVNPTKGNENTNSRSVSKCTFFSLRKRRKKKSFIDCLENKRKTVLMLPPADTNIERKINYINIRNSENGRNEFYNERNYEDKAIRHWNTHKDENNRKDTRYYDHNRSTDLTYKIYYNDLTVDQHENKKTNKKDLGVKTICNKQDSRKSSFSTSLCYYIQSVMNYFGPKNKIAASSDRRHQTYMVMNFEKSDFEHGYNMTPATLSSLCAKRGNSHFKEIESSRNYRLSSYLSEREWMVKQLDYKRCLRNGLQRIVSISECEISIKSAVRFYIFTFN